MSLIGSAGAAAPRLSYGSKLAYGFGAVAFGVKDMGFTIFLLLFYNQVVGVPAALVGAAIMVALIFDAVADLFVGNWSDRLHSRWGRRHPFMYAAALPAGLTYFMLWYPPQGWSDPAMFVYILVVSILVRTCITLFEIPSLALTTELTSDYDERTSISSLRVLFTLLGGLCMTLLTYLVFLQPDATHAVGLLNRDGYARHGIAAAVAIFAAIMISALGTHQRIPYLVQTPPAARKDLRTMFGEIVQTLANRSLLAALGSGFFGAIAVGVGSGLAIYVFTYFWEIPATQMSLYFLCGLVGGLAAVSLAPLVSRRVGKKPAAIAFSVTAIFCLAAPYLLRFAGLMPANGSSELLVLICLFGGLKTGFGTAAGVVLLAMVADIVEDSELKTGRRSEGLLFATRAFVAKVVSGGGIFLSGLILGAIHFPERAEPGAVDPVVVRHLALYYVSLVAICYLLAIAVLGAYYTIDRHTHERNLVLLRERRAVPTAGRSAD